MDLFADTNEDRGGKSVREGSALVAVDSSSQRAQAREGEET